MTEQTEDLSIPTYAPYSTFKNSVGQFREKGVPDRIDKSTLPGSNGTKSALRGAYRFLGLIDEDSNALEPLRLLVNASEDEWSAALKSVVDVAYAEILEGIDLATTTTELLSEPFAKAGLKGQMRLKAMRFALAAFKEAGLPQSPHVKIQNPSTTNGGSKRSRVGRKKAANSDEESTPAFSEPAGAKTHSFQVRKDFEAKILLPLDFSERDRNRLVGFLQLLVFDEDE